MFDAQSPRKQIECHAIYPVFFSIKFLLSHKKQLYERGFKCNAESYSTSSIFFSNTLTLAFAMYLIGSFGQGLIPGVLKFFALY